MPGATQTHPTAAAGTEESALGHALMAGRGPSDYPGGLMSLHCWRGEAVSGGSPACDQLQLFTRWVQCVLFSWIDRTVYGSQPRSCPCEPCTPTSFDTCPALCRWVERDAARSRQEAEKWGRGKPNAQELLMLLGIYFCCLRERTVWGLSTVIQPNDWSGTK